MAAKFLFPSLILATLLACATRVSDPVSRETEVSTALSFINESSSAEAILMDAEDYPVDELKEAEMAQHCGVNIEDETAAVVSLFLGQIIDWLFDGLSESLEERLKEYVAAYSATSTVASYRSTTNGRPVSKWNCFRFTRGTTKSDGFPIDIDLDVVGQFRVVPESDALQVKPLRVYFDKPIAKGEEFSIGASLKASAVWADGNVGRSMKVFEQTLFAEDTSDVRNKAFVKYYDLADWSDIPRLPLIPWSTNQESDVESGIATFEFTVAESGTPPQLLSRAAAYLKKHGDDLSSLVKDTVNAKLDD